MLKKLALLFFIACTVYGQTGQTSVRVDGTTKLLLKPDSSNFYNDVWVNKATPGLTLNSPSNTNVTLQLKRNQSGGSFNTTWSLYNPASTTDLYFFNGINRLLMTADGYFGFNTTAAPYTISILDTATRAGFNLTARDKNTSTSTAAQARDTSAFNFRFTATGKPLVDWVGPLGSAGAGLSVDSMGKWTLRAGDDDRGNYGVALNIKSADGKDILSVMADSNIPGLAAGSNYDALYVWDRAWIEGNLWADGGIALSAQQPVASTTLAYNTPAGVDTMTLTNATNFTADHELWIGTLGTADAEPPNDIKSVSGNRVTLRKVLKYAHTAGDSVRRDRGRGAIYALDAWAPHSPGRGITFGFPLTATEATTDSQTVDINQHVNFVNPLGSVLAPLVMYGGAVDTTAPASMSVTVSAGQFLRGGSGAQAYTVKTSTQTVTHDAADNDSNRVDVVYWNYAGVVKIAKGANGSPAVAPATPTGGTLLAYDTVTAGVSSIASAKIADRRSITVKPALAVFPTFAQPSIGVTSSNYNLNSSTNAEAVDTSAASFTVISTNGKPQMRMVGPTGVATSIIDTSGIGTFASGAAVIGHGATAKTVMDGADGAQTTGQVSIFETGGEMRLTSRDDIVIGLDNDANASSQFHVKSGGTSGTTVFTVEESGALSMSGGVATQGNFGVPIIVDTVVRAAQTADITATNFSNAATAGEYVVYAYLQVTTAGASGTVSVTIGWTDDVGATTTNVINLASTTSTGRVTATPLYIRTASGNVTWATDITVVGGAPEYKINLVCQRLN